MLENIGTHSLKATTLAWAAKAGLSLSTRRLLGQHALPHDKSVLEYSRDELAEPLRQMKELLAHIRSGRFRPDATRSGRWNIPPPILSRDVEILQETRQEEESEPHDPTEHPTDTEGPSSQEEQQDDDSNSSGESDSEEDQGCEATAAARGIRKAGSPSFIDPDDFDAQVWYIHSIWNTIHLLKVADAGQSEAFEDKEGLKLVCGRSVTALYVPWKYGNKDERFCKTCFGKAVGASYGAQPELSEGSDQGS